MTYNIGFIANNYVGPGTVFLMPANQPYLLFRCSFSLMVFEQKIGNRELREAGPSVITIGMLFVGIGVILNSINLMGIVSGWFSNSTPGFDIFLFITACLLTAMAAVTYRYGFFPEAMVMMVIAINDLAFSLVELYGMDVTNMLAFDVLLTAITAMALILILRKREMLLSAIAAGMLVFYCGYLIGGTVGAWIVIVAGFATMIITMLYAAVNWSELQNAMGSDAVDRRSRDSNSTIGMMLIGFNTALISICVISNGTDWFSFAVPGYDILTVVAGILLAAAGLIAFRDASYQKSSLMMLAALSSIVFGLAEFHGCDIPSMGVFDLLLACVTALVAALTWRGENVIQTAAAWCLALFFFGFFIAGDIGNGISAVAGLAVLVLTLAYAALSWHALIQSEVVVDSKDPSENSAATVGTVLFGLNVAFVAVSMLGMLTGWYGFDKHGYDLLSITASCLLAAIGLMAYRQGSYRRSAPMLFAAVSCISFGIMEYIGIDVTTLGVFDIALAVMAAFVCIMTWFGKDIIQVAMTACLTAYFAGFSLGGDAGGWIVIVAGLALFVAALVSASLEWMSIQDAAVKEVRGD
jgi:hypothetical protein